MRRVQSNTLDVGIDVHLKNWSTAILSKHSVLRRFLQVDCEGPTLISYIVAKHLAHASRGTISPYRTSGSAYGGSLFYVQSDIVIHKTGIAREPEFIIGRCMVHYTLRICPIPLAAIPIYACPIGLDSAFDEIGNPCLWVFPTFPYTHSYPSAKPLINSYQR